MSDYPRGRLLRPPASEPGTVWFRGAGHAGRPRLRRRHGEDGLAAYAFCYLLGWPLWIGFVAGAVGAVLTSSLWPWR